MKELFGDIGVRNGWISHRELEECLKLQEKKRARGENQNLLGQILYNQGYLSQQHLKKIIELQDLNIVYCIKCNQKYTILKYVYKQTRCPCCKNLVVESKVPSDLWGPISVSPEVTSEPNLSSDLNIGEFELIAKWGEDTSGTLFFANQTTRNRPVTLKVWSSEKFEQSDFRRSALAEVKKVAELKHPNIKRVYTIGKSKGRHYIAMEYVQGESLGSILEERRAFPYKEALELVRCLAGSLIYAHQNGVFHGDIRPSQIIITTDDPKIKLANLGLIPNPLDNFLSFVGPGTREEPFYLAPEQVTSPNNTSGKSDIFSLGCILYYLISGTPPYKGRSPMKILTQMSEKKLPSLSNIDQGIPEEMNRILNRMLQIEPSRRYDSMEEVLHVLNEIPGEQASTPIPVTHNENVSDDASPTPSPKSKKEAIENLEKPKFHIAQVKTHKKGKEVFVLLSIVFLCIIGGAIFAYKGFHHSNSPSVNNSSSKTQENICPVCGGTGWIKKHCTMCMSRGTVPCYSGDNIRCQNGVVERIIDGKWVPYGPCKLCQNFKRKGMKICPECGGEGYIKLTCSECAGTGKVKRDQ